MAQCILLQHAVSVCRYRDDLESKCRTKAHAGLLTKILICDRMIGLRCPCERSLWTANSLSRKAATHDCQSLIVYEQGGSMAHGTSELARVAPLKLCSNYGCACKQLSKQGAVQQLSLGSRCLTVYYHQACSHNYLNTSGQEVARAQAVCRHYQHLRAHHSLSRFP